MLQVFSHRLEITGGHIIFYDTKINIKLKHVVEILLNAGPLTKKLIKLLNFLNKH